MGRCRSLGLMKLLWCAAYSGASVLFFSILNPLRVYCLGRVQWLMTWWHPLFAEMRGGILCLHPLRVFGFWPYHMACRILVPQLGTEPWAPSVKVPSLNHWTTREFPSLRFFVLLSILDVWGDLYGLLFLYISWNSLIFWFKIYHSVFKQLTEFRDSWKDSLIS